MVLRIFQRINLIILFLNIFFQFYFLFSFFFFREAIISVRDIILSKIKEANRPNTLLELFESIPAARNLPMRSIEWCHPVTLDTLGMIIFIAHLYILSIIRYISIFRSCFCVYSLRLMICTYEKNLQRDLPGWNENWFLIMEQPCNIPLDSPCS